MVLPSPVMIHLTYTKTAELAETDMDWFNISVPAAEVAANNESMLTAFIAVESLTNSKNQRMYITTGAKPIVLELNDAREELKMVKTDLDNAQADLATSDEELTHLKKEVIEADEARRERDRQMSELDAAHARLRTTLAQSQSKYKELEANSATEMALLQAELTESRSKVAALRDELTGVQTKLNRYVNAHDAMRTIFASAQTPVRVPMPMRLAPGVPNGPSPNAGPPIAPGSPVADTGLQAPSPNGAPPPPEAASPLAAQPASPSAGPTEPRFQPIPGSAAASDVSELPPLPNAEELAGYFDDDDDARATFECGDCGRSCNSTHGLKRHRESCPVAREKRLKTTDVAFVVVKRGTIHRDQSATILWTIDEHSRVRDGYTIDRALVCARAQ